MFNVNKVLLKDKIRMILAGLSDYLRLIHTWYQRVKDGHMSKANKVMIMGGNGGWGGCNKINDDNNTIEH